MADEVLSQEEVDALITEADAASDAEGSDGPAAEAIHEVEGGVRAVEFGQLGGVADPGARRGVELILDVQMNVAVELGRTTMQIRDVLALGPGSIVELDKHSSEAVEVVVNNKVVARGEVVVIDENFGVRVTEIMNAIERNVHARAA